MINFRFFLTCGNSSAVEHDLAKVGVASSNLVSRSTIFLLLISTLTFANINESIAEAVLIEFEKQYPCIDSDLPEIHSTSPLPLDFKDYKLIKVILRPNVFRKRIGSFKAIFKTPKKEKSLYFKFNIDANIDIFKAKHKLYNDKILSDNDYEKVSVKIDKLPSKVITCSMPKKLMTKNYVSANSILTMNRFEYKKDLLRGDKVRSYIRDGMLVIETEATLISDGDIGEVVKIKVDNGKVFKAKLISKHQAIILE